MIAQRTVVAKACTREAVREICSRRCLHVILLTIALSLFPFPFLQLNLD